MFKLKGEKGYIKGWVASKSKKLPKTVVIGKSRGYSAETYGLPISKISKIKSLPVKKMDAVSAMKSLR